MTMLYTPPDYSDDLDEDVKARFHRVYGPSREDAINNEIEARRMIVSKILAERIASGEIKLPEPAKGKSMADYWRDIEVELGYRQK